MIYHNKEACNQKEKKMGEKILKEVKKKKSQRIFGWGIFWAVTILGLPIVFYLAFLAALSQRVYQGIFVCGQELSGKTKIEAEKMLEDYLKVNLPKEIVLLGKVERFTLSLNFFTYSAEQTVQNALAVGRENNFFQKIKSINESLLKKKTIPFFLTLNNQELDQQIASVAAELYVPATEPQIKIVKNQGEKQILVETGTNGREVNIRELKQNLLKSLTCPKSTIVLEIPIREVSPKITEEEAEILKKRASNFLGKQLTFELDKQTWTIDDETLISFLAKDDNLEEERIENFIEKFAQTVNTQPKNATFLFDQNTNKVTVFEPSKEGIRLKKEELKNLLWEKIRLMENTGEDQRVVLPIEKIPPQITTKDANELGIKELIGEGSSFFAGSIAERIHNLTLASLKLKGVLIPPGEIFSFNQSLGEVSANTGYKQAYIIKAGRTVLGDGGGVCQVSTTLFRAALNAGLPIIERYAHAYRVHYYEEDIGPGFDATVFDPNYDLKFQNNTPGYILIQSEVDKKQKKLIFGLYGTKDNREVKISKARIWDIQPPPPDLYQEDPTLPEGTIKQIDWKAWGAKVAFDYKVTLGNEILFEKTFTSYYKPWQAVYLKGVAR